MQPPSAFCVKYVYVYFSFGGTVCEVLSEEDSIFSRVPIWKKYSFFN